MTVLIIDADAPGDAALENSHWVAGQIAAVLVPDVVTHRGAEATRATLESAMRHEVYTGFVYCGHGRDAALVHADEHLLDLSNVGLVGRRWFHAFACNSGNTLALTASEQVGAYLGYHRPVIVEWTVANLPPDVLEILRTIVTVATLALQQGVRSRAVIRRRVRAAVDEWLVWRDAHDEDEDLPLRDRMGLSALALLYENMEFHGIDVTD